MIDSYVIKTKAIDEDRNDVLESLSLAGIPVAFLDVNYMEKYPWPEKFDIRPNFDGFVTLIGSNNPEEQLRKVLGVLKQKFMVSPHQSWIFGIEGCLNLKSTTDFFDEGDRVLMVGEIIADFLICKPRHFFQQEFQLWSLHSTGNGSKHFIQKGFWSPSNATEYMKEPLFDLPFTNFGGRVLKISSLGSPPIKEPPLKGEKKWRGYIFHVVNVLGDIFNFTYTVKEADNRFYGILHEDGSYSGMMGELYKKSVDMGVGDLSWTLERTGAADLSKTIFPETVTFIYRAPDFYSRTWILFQDIDVRIWISLLTTMTIVSIAYCFALFTAESLEHRANLDEGSVFVEVAIQSIGSLGRAILGQGITRFPSNVSCRALLGTWILGSLVLASLYGGSLTSTLSLHRTPSPADSVGGLMRRYPNAMLALRNNSNVHSYFKGSTFWRKLFLNNIHKNVIPGKYTIDDIMVEVHKKGPEGSPIYAWIGERSTLVKKMHVYTDDKSVCDLYVGNGDILRSDWTLALVRNSPFLDQFDDIIIRLQRFGILQKWHDDTWKSGSGDCRPTDGRNPTGKNPISLEDTQASFFVLGLGWAAGFLALLVEKGVFKWLN
ncbi:hypothetical protein JTE90_014743 [Oedothorax gibbosus]|uniref:Ionotropic glutamate receptor L-glutamate and glycine-binding domain-containing protein n=1 Tax=Oedothorax gibbosus TaxID=931172 RepID=A0AAV6UQB6_9ARAC|nr:hypothetical protein JTE90_014743 [Oedothorax gibbosus]